MARSRPTDTRGETSRELAAELGGTLATCKDLKWAAVIRKLQATESRFVDLVSSSPILVLEVRRRVAENLCSAAILKRLPFQTCRQLFMRMAWLGFSDPYSRHQLVLGYARYCLAAGHPDEGVRYLNEWAEILRAEHPKAAAGLLPSIEQLIALIHAGGE